MATSTAIPSSPTRRTPPGPKGHWFWGNVAAFRPDRLTYLTDCARRYGDVVALRLGPLRVWVLNHPDLIEEVLVTKSKSFIKHSRLRVARPTLGNGLLLSEGEFWRRQRKLAQPAFHRDQVASYAETMVRYAERMLCGWADGQPRDAQADMMELTLQIVAKCLFDADVSDESAGARLAMEALTESFTRRVNQWWIRLPMSLPTPANRRFQRARSRVIGLIHRIVAERRASGEDRGDLLSRLLHARDEDDGSGMTDRQLRDELMTLFLAGHETTANTLSWAFVLLARHPEAEAALHAELDAVLGDRPPTVADLPRLRYTDWVITETLRVYPTVWLLGREAIEPVTIGEYRVPKGMTLWMSQWVLHRDPRYFEDPEAFRPERWANDLVKRIPRYAYFPFGGGPRICIGNGFAQMEAVLLLATIARRFRLPLAPGAVIQLNPTITLRPKDGVPVILQERRARREGP